MLFITSAAFILNHCSGDPSLPVDIQDEPLYVIKGSPLQAVTFPQYAVQEYFLSSGQTDMTKDQVDLYMDSLYLSGDAPVLMPLSAFSEFNSEIAKLCSNTPCNYEALQKLSALIYRLKQSVAHSP